MNEKEAAQKEFDVESSSVDTAFITICTAMAAGMLVLLSVKTSESKVAEWLHIGSFLCFMLALGLGLWNKFRKAKRKLHAAGELDKLVKDLALLLEKSKEVFTKQYKTQMLALIALHPELKDASKEDFKKTFDSHFPLSADTLSSDYIQLTAEKFAGQAVDTHRRAYHLPMPERWGKFKMRLDGIARKYRFWILFLGMALVVASMVAGAVTHETPTTPAPVAHGLPTR